MKDVIVSILKSGVNSHYLNKFIEICVNMSQASINISKYREYILNKTGLSAKDIAYDAIADLFKASEGKYVYFNNYFENNLTDIENTPEEILKSKLAAIVISRTHQRITEIREDFGEIYFKIKRAVYLHLKRHINIFKKIIYNETTYIFTCRQKDLNFEKEQIPESVLLDILNSNNHDNYSITKIANFIFEKINKEEEYNKTISETDLFLVISDFFKSRMSDFLAEPENVQYYQYEDI